MGTDLFSSRWRDARRTLRASRPASAPATSRPRSPRGSLRPGKGGPLPCAAPTPTNRSRTGTASPPPPRGARSAFRVRSGRGPDRSKEAEPRHPAVRIDVQARVRGGWRRPQILESVDGVGAERRRGQDFLPPALRRQRITGLQHLERATPRRVSLEIARVHFDAADDPGKAEAQDRPVVTGPASPLRFPAVVHPERRAGKNEVVPLAEEHVARAENESAVLQGREVDLLAGHRGLRGNETVHAEPRDAAVRIDVELDVSDAA